MKQPFSQLKSWGGDTAYLCLRVGLGEQDNDCFFSSQLQRKKSRHFPASDKAVFCFTCAPSLSRSPLPRPPLHQCPHTQARRERLIHVFILTLKKKKKKDQSAFCTLFLPKLLLPFENMNALEWFLYFQRVKVLKSTSLFPRGGKKVNQPA